MKIYRMSGDGLLTLARMAADAPNADPNIILGIIKGCDVEDDEAPMPDVRDGPQVGAEPAAAEPGEDDGSDKLAKPE